MKMLTRLTVAVIWIVTLTGVASAQDVELTEYFPSHTLAYLELRHPGQVSREMLGLIKGSYVENLQEPIARFRDELGDSAKRRWNQILTGPECMLLTPESWTELSRIQGAAIAWTGFNRDKEPEIVGVILAGDSNVPVFIQRIFVLADSSMRKVDEAEGVMLYRQKREDYRDFKAVPAGQPEPPPVIKWMGPTYALLPGAIVIGSTPESVKDVVLRIKGKSAEPSLASKTVLKNAGKMRQQPGLFAYADVAAISDRLDEIFKANQSIRVTEWTALKTLINPKAFRGLTANLSVQNSAMELHLDAVLEPNQTSPLLEILPDKKAALDLMHSTPKDTLAAMTISLPDGEKRWAKLVELLDSVAKSAGEHAEDMPSKAITDIETNSNVRIGKDVMAKITGLALLVHAGRADKDRRPLPMLLLSTENESAAKTLAELLPKLLAFDRPAGAAPAPPEDVQGQSIREVSWRLMGSQVQLGRTGSTLVIGLDRKAVAEALTAGTKKEGFLADPKITAATKDLNEPVLVGVLSSGKMLTELLTAESTRSSETHAAAGPKPAAPKKEEPAKPLKPAAPAAEEKSLQELTKAAESLPPAVLTISRKPDRLLIDLRQTGTRPISAKLIDAVIDLLLRREKAISEAGGGRGVGGGNGVPEIPDPID